MTLRYLFGPVGREFADRYLAGPRRAGACLAFGPGPGADVLVTSTDRWDDVERRLPPHWRPDVIVLYLPYRCVPPAAWEAPVPAVGLALDWNLQWHGYRGLFSQCERVFSDRAGVERLVREGVTQAQHAFLYGCPRAWLVPMASVERDIDLLFVGNINSAVQRVRLPWLGRLGRLAKRWKVLIATNVFGDAYRALLGRAKIVFNRSIRGEANQRAFEATAAGALLLQEAGNPEMEALFVPSREFVAYTNETLEATIEHLLTHDNERRAIAEAGRLRAQGYCFEDLWGRAVDQLACDLPELVDRRRRRASLGPTDLLIARAWQFVGSGEPADATLPAELAASVAGDPTNARLAGAAGLVLARAQALASATGGLDKAIRHFQRGWAAGAGDPTAGLNVAEALALTGDRAKARECARLVLNALAADEGGERIDVTAGHVPVTFDQFRVEWERAAWDSHDRAAERRAKQRLLRWRAHSLVAELTADPVHAYEAALVRPELTVGTGLLGRTLMTAGRFVEAVPHLRATLKANPFDRGTARLLHQALSKTGDRTAPDRLAADRRRLSRAAPGLVPAEPWFTKEGRTPLAIAWHGPIDGQHSYAVVNRALCDRLRARGHRIILDGPVPPEAVHVSHCWPPAFDRAPGRPWVVIQPWEYGAMPAAWVNPLSSADEVWVPSRHVRDSYVRGGVPAELVRVIPNGVDVTLFGPDGPRLALPTTKRFKFLFVGGTIHRKGADLLLRAYSETFTAADDVCLVLKDVGTESFYGGQTSGPLIADLRRAGGPDVVYLTEHLSEADLASLYRACNCLVHPYRGEGFGLPILEAMATGLPVITTGAGAAVDFCTTETAYLIPARRVSFAVERIGPLPTVGRPWLFEPDTRALAGFMRHVVDHPEEARAKGDAGRTIARQRYTWDQVADHVEERLRAVAEQRGPGANVAGQVPRLRGDQERRGRVSLCLIARDAAATIRRCLESAADLVDEIVVLDTGSADDTPHLARAAGATVVPVPWPDSFAAARNLSIEAATGDWVFWLDADEYLDGPNRERLRAVLASLPTGPAAFLMRQVSSTPGPRNGTLIVDQVRLFRRHPTVRWEYRVHEQILLAIRRAGHPVTATDVEIAHVGFASTHDSTAKLERNLRLLRLDEAERPDDPVVLYHLGLACQQAGAAVEAAGYHRHCLDRAPAEFSFRAKAYAALSRLEQRSGRADVALQVCQAGRREWPHDRELLFQEASVQVDRREWDAAERCLVEVLAPGTGRSLNGLNTALTGDAAVALLADVRRRRGDTGSFTAADGGPSVSPRSPQ